MIRVEKVGPDEGSARLAAVEAFVGAHPSATAYSSPSWLSAMGRFMDVTTRYHVAELHDRIVGVLPVAESTLLPRGGLLPERIRPLRRESLGHDCYAGPLLAAGLDEATLGQTLAALVDSLDAGPTILSTMFPPAWADLDDVRRRLVSEHGYREVRAYPIAVKPLVGLTESSLPSTYTKSHRNAADAAKRRGVVVSPAADVGDYLEFCDLLDETMDHAGITASYSKDIIVEGGQSLVRSGAGQLLLGRVDGRAIAGAFFLHASRSACYWLGATAKDERALKFRPMNAILPQAFALAIAAGCEWFELGGLMTDGLRAFKTGWGARELVQPTYERSYRDLAEPLRALRTSARELFRKRRPSA